MPFRERRAGFLSEFSYRYPWRLLEQRHPLATLATSKHGQIGDDDVDDIRPGERPRTLREQLWLSRATHVIHPRDHTTKPGHQITRPPDALHHLSRQDRKRLVPGKSVLIRVNHGGRRIIQKQHNFSTLTKDKTKK